LTDSGQQESRAIAVHSEQASLFSERYQLLDADPYGSSFAYSRHRLQILLDRLLPKAAPGARLLDVGCGTGHHMAWARQRGFSVAGVDGSEAMLAEARRLDPEFDVRLADVNALPYGAAEFDALLCIEVLRYLADTEPCIAELARVVKPGGCCLATASPLFNLSGFPLFNQMAERFPCVRAVGLRQYFHTTTGLRRRFHQAGFRDVTVAGVYLSPGNWVERLAPRRLPGFLRGFERWDQALCNRPVLRELSGMLLVHARR
jgi:ubiquinone/menaquinone biosynthesis C-methylase UbiE